MRIAILILILATIIKGDTQLLKPQDIAQTRIAAADTEGESTRMIEEISKVTGLSAIRAKDIESILILAGKEDASDFSLEPYDDENMVALCFKSAGESYKAILSGKNLFMQYIIDSNGNIVFAIEE